MDPELERSGIASQLLEAITATYLRAGARMMIVDTDAENTGAIHFFHRHGFGSEERHVYLSKNLTGHPDYWRLRRRKGD